MAEAKHAQILNSREQPSIQINNGSFHNIKSESFTDPAKANGLAPATTHSRTGSSDSGEGLLLSASDLQARSGGCSKSINNNNSFGSAECSAKDHAAGHQRSADYNCCDIIDSLRNGGGEKTLTDVIKQQGMGQAGHRAKSTMSTTPASCDHGSKDGEVAPCNGLPAEHVEEIDGLSSSRHLPNVDMTKSVAFAKLEAELASAQKELKLKEEEVTKLSKIREEVESELHELTASLFQEAHRMVQEANVKAASAERCLHEADMKIDGLETEVAALKTLVLTSTPARPNRHLLHARNDSRCNGSRPSSASSSNLAIASPALNGSHMTSNGSMSNLIVGAGGLLGAKADDICGDDTSFQTCCCNSGFGESEKEKYIDPGLRKDFLAWKKDPSFDRGTSDFLERLYREDIDLCLDFPNAELSKTLRLAVERNALCINPLVGKEFEDNALPNACALFEAPLLCRFHVRLMPSEDAEAGEKVSEVDFYVCQLARNRIISVCDCLTYLRYIKQGMVKSHHNDVYWQILEYRKKMALARLGFAPD